MTAVLCVDDDIDHLDFDLDNPGPRGRESHMKLVPEPPACPTANAIDRALIVGDMHGNLFAWQRTILPAARRARANVIIQLGDFGFGWDFHYLGELDEMLRPHGIPVLWIDGNHENFDMLESVGAFSQPPRPEPTQTSELTWYLPRGYSWEWYGKKMLAVGGAYSVDKPYRTAHVSWWEQEELTDLDRAVAQDQGEVDVVFSHDVFLGPRVPGVHAEWKQDEFAALSAPNRNRLLSVKHTTRPSIWFHGHYHVAYEKKWGDMTIVGLNRESETGSMIVLDFPSLERRMP